MKSNHQLSYRLSQAFHSIVLLMTLSVVPCFSQEKAGNKFFNGKDLTGWSAADMQYWTVEKGVIVGTARQEVNHNQFLWSNQEVSDFYLAIDVLLEPDDRNAGIQFRSRKADKSGQAIGYQADMGKDVWGKLYHEHGRQKLDWSDRGAKAVKPGQWNRYEILASGDRIWTAINGKLAVAVKDPKGEKSGYIALQIHSGPPQTVRYKIRELVHNPKIKLAGLDEAQLNQELKKPEDGLGSLFSPTRINDNDVIALMGGTNMVNMRKDSYLETLLLAANARKKLHVWNLGWDGDTVYEQFRDVGFGSWSQNLDSLGATIVLVQFGQLESLDGVGKIPDFLSAYKQLIAQAQKHNRQLVLISPVPFEPAQLSRFSKKADPNPLQNTAVAHYSEAIKGMAKELGIPFADLYSELQQLEENGPFTYDGIHLTAPGRQVAAAVIMKELGQELAYSPMLDALKSEIQKKNDLWINYWRPGNWAFLGGDRTTVPFSYDWQNTSRRIFPEEIKSFEPLIRDAENRIAQQLRALSPPQ